MDSPTRSTQPPDPVPATTRPPREPLDDRARTLLDNPEVQVLLPTTSRDFPHIVNRLAAAWFEPRQFWVALDALLLDDRAKRQGLPMRIAMELSELRMYYEERVAPVLLKASLSRQAELAREQVARKRRLAMRADELQAARRRRQGLRGSRRKLQLVLRKLLRGCAPWLRAASR